MANRISRVVRRLGDIESDAAFISSLPDIRWACGFTGSNGVLVVDPDKAKFITDGRYIDQADQEVQGAVVHIAREGLFKYMDEKNLLRSYEQVAYQADDLTVSQHSGLEECHPDVTWQPVNRLVTHLVARKDEDEVDCIREAQSITESVFEEIVDVIEPGISERQLAAEIIYCHLKRGADKMSFEPIVASGPNAARPHARPTDRTLQDGDLVVLDMGCFLNGYASDMTRTVAIGRPSDDARQGYEAVRKAQKEALGAATSGMTGKALDKVARDVLETEGLGDYFTHGLGHGIGLQVHEWPRVSHTADDELPNGVCVTVEPGVYVPEQDYGVRIEDIVSLYPDGSVNLTTASKDFLVL